MEKESLGEVVEMRIGEIKVGSEATERKGVWLRGEEGGGDRE